MLFFQSNDVGFWIVLLTVLLTGAIITYYYYNIEVNKEPVFLSGLNLMMKYVENSFKKTN
jgi:hypothetical protein